MKKPFYVLLIISFALLSFSNGKEPNKAGDKNRIENNSDHNLLQGSWGPWKAASCFTHIKYRVKKDSYPTKWYIEFQNNYNQKISMSVTIENGTGGERCHIGSGDTEVNHFWTYSETATSIEFTIDKVKFNDTNWGGPYADCD